MLIRKKNNLNTKSKTTKNPRHKVKISSSEEEESDTSAQGKVRFLIHAYVSVYACMHAGRHVYLYVA